MEMIQNQNFRDESLKHSYPFDERSTLEDDLVYIGTDLVIDACFYVKAEVRLPVYIRVIDGTAPARGVNLIIADADGRDIGSAILSHEDTTVTVRNPVGVSTGVLVFNAEAVDRFIGRVEGSTFVLLPEVASFVLGVCHSSAAEHLRYVQVAGTALSRAVKVVARHGCRFTTTPTGLRLDVLGSPPDLGSERRPVLSVNSVHHQSIWLANHPQSNLRIVNADGGITFTQAKEDV